MPARSTATGAEIVEEAGRALRQRELDLGHDALIARLILLNGAPGIGKTTLARRYVEDHDGAVLVEVDAFRMTLPDWEHDEGTRLVARDLAAAALEEHLSAGRDVVMPQYFGRLGYLELLDGMARMHGAMFVEVVLASDAATATDRFRARRLTLAERGDRHPERDIAEADVESFIADAVQRLARLPAARPATRVVDVPPDAAAADVYLALLAVMGEPAL